MRFDLIDHVLEQQADRIVAVKQVSAAEEYLGDHFPGFPILPGVMMIETLVQAARRMLQDQCVDRLVLGNVRALKYGAMVRPGEALQVEVTLSKQDDDGSYQCKGVGRVLRRDDRAATDETAVSGKFTMRPVRGA
jgi:3-hydroxyacyl-[acyl-carrier-protein] dehydratase